MRPKSSKPPTASPGRKGQRSGSKPKVVMASGIAVYCAHRTLADIASLKPNPRNPNQHGDKQVALLAKIIQSQGWRAPIVVSVRSGFVVKGHGRLSAAKLLGVELVPVDFQDYATEADEWADMLADNKIAELADLDQSKVDILLTDLGEQGFDLDLTGFADKQPASEIDPAAITITEKHEVIIECESEAEQQEVYSALTDKNFKCRLLTY